jgi:dUTP pyrophosphatase
MKTNLLETMKEKLFTAISGKENYNLENFMSEFSNNKTSVDFNKINLKFKNTSNNPNPDYTTNGSSGFDLRANLEKDVWLAAQGGIEVIPTGLFFEIPENFEIQVRPRSGLAAKNGVTVLNTPGTIDSDYRGELKVILINHGLIPFCVKHGDRIAQAVFASVLAKNVVYLQHVNEIDNNTERSSGGLGSTGIK